MTRSTICVTGLRGIPNVMGGVETHCEELLPRVAALAPDIQILVLGRRGYILPDNKFGGVRVKAIFAPRSVAWEAICSTLIAVFRASRSASAVHIHAIGPGLVTPLARALGLRVVFTHHGEDYKRAKWGRLARVALRLGEFLSVTTANATIAVSPSLADRLRRRFPRRASKIHYIPNGVPRVCAPRSARETLDRFNLASGQFVLSVSRLVPEKGTSYLIEAFRRSGTTRRLVIVGASDHDTDYARRLLRQADDKVVFLGAQDREVLAALYQAADLFVLPSFHEGLPISALEAASAGSPILLSDIQANKDLGLPDINYFPIGNVEELAERLKVPSSKFAIRQDEILQRFDWSKIAIETVKIYREVVPSER